MIEGGDKLTRKGPRAKHNCAVPYICTRGAEAAIEWYKQAFGAREVGKRYPWEGKIGHAEIDAEGALIMLADEFSGFSQSPPSLGGTSFSIHLDVGDVDALFSRATTAGAIVLKEPTDEPDGRRCKLRDPFGHEWMFNSVVKSPAKVTSGSKSKGRRRK